jgi:hypothetical protein
MAGYFDIIKPLENNDFKRLASCEKKLLFQYSVCYDKIDTLDTKELTPKGLYKVLFDYKYDNCVLIFKDKYYDFTATFEPLYWERGKNKGQLKGYGVIIKIK